MLYYYYYYKRTPLVHLTYNVCVTKNGHLIELRFKVRRRCR